MKGSCKRWKKVKVGFVGVGWIGECQFRRLAEREDVEVLFWEER